MLRALAISSVLALTVLVAGRADAQDSGVAEARTGFVLSSPDVAAEEAADDMVPPVADPAAQPGEDGAEEDVDPDDPVERAREQLRAARLGELAARTRAALQVARPLARASGDVTRIERALPGTEREIERLAHPARLARIPQLSQRELAELRQDWRRHAHRLERWQETIGQRAAEVETSRVALVDLKRTWSELRDVSIAAGRPDGRHERIVAGLDESRHGVADLEEVRDSLTELADRVSDLQITAEDVADRLRDASSAYRERLGVRDAPPIHLGLAATGAEEGSVAAQARAMLVERTETPDELLAELLPAAVALAVGFALLLGLLLALARPPSSEGAARRLALGELAQEVVRHPASSAALLSLLAASFVIEHAPVVVYDVIFFATLVPLFRAVPPLCPTSLRPLVRGAIVFAAIDRVEFMLTDGTSVLRVVLLLEAVGGLAALVVWLRGHSEARLWARGLAVLAAGLLATALVANLLGYLFLATVLSRGLGFSVYNGLALAGAVVVIEAIVDLVVVSPVGQRLRSLERHAELVHARTLRLLSLVAVLAWLAATLEGFGLWGPLSAWAESALREEHDVGSLEISLGAVLGAVLILVLTSYLLRLVRFVLTEDVLPRLALEPGVDGAISGLTSYAVGGTGLLLSLAYLGIDASQIALVAGALGVGIGFGLQGIVANFIAGIVLMLERPVRLGDFIEVGSLVGSVDRIGLRSSTVKALDGAEVIVPNESLISREVVNWTLSDRKRRVEVKVGVAYGTDPHRVVDILRKVAVEHRDPSVGAEPEVLFDAFGESSLDFTLQFWARSFAHSIELKSEVGLAVHDALVAAGIEIPFPQRDLHIKGGPTPKS